MNKNVLLVAVGGIGFRHFQALLNCVHSFNLYVVDISEEAILRAREYAQTTECRCDIHYYKSMENIPKQIDVAIIATSSKPRKKVLDELIRNHTVNNIIFEKVLFTTLSDYTEAKELLSQKGINAYVDCIARTYPSYQWIKEDCKGTKYFVANMRGSNWGLACNAIHLVDQVAYISGADVREFQCTAILEKEIYESKRDGYVEFFGRLMGSIGERCKFSIECDHSTNPLVFEFYTDKAYYFVNEAERVLTKVEIDTDCKEITKEFELLYVSQATSISVDKLLEGDKIDLPSFDDSVYLHEALHKSFQKTYNMTKQTEGDYLPIT